MTIRPSLKYVVYALMIGYVLFVASSFFMLYDRSESYEAYVKRALADASALRHLSGEIGSELPGLLTAAYMSHDDMRRVLARQNARLMAAYERLKSVFRGDPELINAIGASLNMLKRGKRDAAVVMDRNTAYSEASDYLHATLMPQLDAIHVQIDAIWNSIVGDMNDAHQVLHTRMLAILIASVVFGAIIILIVVLYDRSLMQQADALAYRGGLLRQLANSIDDVFIVARDAAGFDYVAASADVILRLAPGTLEKKPEALYAILEAADADWLRDSLAQSDLEQMQERDIFAPKLNNYLKIRIYPMTVAATGQKRKIIVISDQTKMMLHQQALSDALESAHATSAAKSGFLSHMSHEIRTPMNAIIGMTTIALSRINDISRVKDCLHKISDSSRHLLGLINDVLDMSKIESGKLNICNKSFNLHQAVENISNIVRPQTQNRKQNFEILVENVDEENLIGDAMRLNQILLNILSNAMKFTPEDGSIIMKLTQIGKKNGRVRIRFTISDTGIGMSQEFLERIYKPFEQAESNTAAKYGGTGLGMSITANLVAMMGGSIHVTSKEGEGTSFFIELPFETSGDDGEAQEQLPLCRVLVVDDDRGSCEHACQLLEKMGIAPVWALSGEEATDMARQAHERGEGFEVCLIDWTMPGMNGAETARAIRGVVGDDALVIIISAYDWAAIEDEARHAGADDFIAKPFFASTLYYALAQAARKLDAGGTSEQIVDVKSGHDFSGKRVLLVEDNEFNREIGEEFLQMVNIEVDHAENGKEAVDKVVGSAEGYYDLVLMDVQMPIMDGYEATRAIRASSHPEAKSMIILAITANAFDGDVANAVAAGMNGHIAKPIDVNELYKVLGHYLGNNAHAE